MSDRETTTVNYLVPPESTADSKGEGSPFDLGSLAGKPLLIILRIAEIIEQEALRVSVWGSKDGKDWGQKALFWFPEKFYRGLTPARLDLRQVPDVKFLQARWEVNRWGRGYPLPYFKFSVEARELDAN